MQFYDFSESFVAEDNVLSIQCKSTSRPAYRAGCTIPADPGSDAPVHISCVRQSPLDLLHHVSVVRILYHGVHFALTHVSVTCVLRLKTYRLCYRPLCLHLLKFLRMFNASSDCRC